MSEIEHYFVICALTIDSFCLWIPFHRPLKLGLTSDTHVAKFYLYIFLLTLNHTRMIHSPPSRKFSESFFVLYRSYSVQFSSVAQSCPTFCDPMYCSCQSSLSITSSWSLLKLVSIELVMPSNHLILCCPLLLLPSNFPSIRVFSKDLYLLLTGGRRHQSGVLVKEEQWED